jgi:hypothetical protein
MNKSISSLVIEPLTHPLSQNLNPSTTIVHKIKAEIDH